MSAAVQALRWFVVSLPALAVVVIAAGVAFVIGGWHGAMLVAVAAGISASLLLDVQLPQGGTISLGHALVLAVPQVLDMRVVDVVVVVGLVLAVAWLLAFSRFGLRDANQETLAIAAAALPALAIAFSFDAGRPELNFENTANVVFLQITLSGTAYFTVDFWARRRRLQAREHELVLRDALPIYVAFVCAAALLAIAYDRGGFWFALVAALPLFVTRYSFERYAIARETYRQTVQALSFLPEVAGLAPLGHAQRSATYANALCDVLGIDEDDKARVVNVTRLHHIGDISLHDPSARTETPDPAELGQVGVEILQETGFRGDLADLMEEVHGRSSRTRREAAIVRVAGTFDGLVGEHAGPLGPIRRQLLEAHVDPEERFVASVLLRLLDDRPHLIEEARLAGEPLTRVASERAAADPGDHSHCV